MSLDRAAVIRNTKQLTLSLGLNPSEVVLGAGSALVLLGLRKHTSDLDVDVPPEFFEKQKARKGAKQGLAGEYVEWDGITDIHPFLSGTKNRRFEMDGVYYYCPSVLYAQKLIMAAHPDRPQDKVFQDNKDIKALHEHMEFFGLTHNSTV